MIFTITQDLGPHAKAATLQAPVSDFPFAAEQALWINTDGSLPATVVGRTMRLYGWIEP